MKSWSTNLIEAYNIWSTLFQKQIVVNIESKYSIFYSFLIDIIQLILAKMLSNYNFQQMPKFHNYLQYTQKLKQKVVTERSIVEEVPTSPMALYTSAEKRDRTPRAICLYTESRARDKLVRPSNETYVLDFVGEVLERCDRRRSKLSLMSAWEARSHFPLYCFLPLLQQTSEKLRPFSMHEMRLLWSYTQYTYISRSLYMSAVCVSLSMCFRRDGQMPNRWTCRGGKLLYWRWIMVMIFFVRRMRVAFFAVVVVAYFYWCMLYLRMKVMFRCADSLIDQNPKVLKRRVNISLLGVLIKLQQKIKHFNLSVWSIRMFLGQNYQVTPS